MPDPKQTEAFRRIAAPAALRERVLQAEPKSTRVYRVRAWQPVAAMVACIAVVITATQTHWVEQAAPEAADRPAMVAALPESRGMPVVSGTPASVQTELTLTADATLSVTAGEVQLVEAQTNALAAMGETITVPRGTYHLWWDVADAQPNETYTLTVTEGTDTRTLSLEYDTPSGEWKLK